MADAQAIPQNLFSYSDQTTRANTDLQTWITSTLGPAVRLYQETAIDLGNNITDLTAPGTGSIDVDARNALSKIWDTDKQVRAVGQAFQDAGDTGAGTIAYVPDSVITTQLANEQQIQAGKQLAQYVQKHGVDKYVWQQLKANENNPYYTAAFFNGLTPDQLSLLYDSTSQGSSEMSVLATALANAYATGLLSTSVKDNVKQWLKLLPQSEFYTDFMTALAKDPQAALHFIDTLSDAEMRDFAAGLDTTTDTSEPANYPVMFMAVCAAAMSSVNDNSPTTAQALLNRIYNAFSSTYPRNMDSMTGPLNTLLINFCNKSFGAPPTYNSGNKSADWTSLQKWIDSEVNTTAADAWKFAQWIYTVDGGNNAETVLIRQLTEGALAAGLLAVLPPPADVVTGAMLESVLSGWVVAEGDTAVFGSGPDPQKPEMQFFHTQAKYAAVAMAAQFLNAGDLVYVNSAGQQVALTPEAVGCSQRDLLQWIMTHQNNVMVKGSGQYFSAIVTQVETDYFNATVN